jgi:hypothetical protein
LLLLFAAAVVATAAFAAVFVAIYLKIGVSLIIRNFLRTTSTTGTARFSVNLADDRVTNPILKLEENNEFSLLFFLQNIFIYF